MTYHAPRLERAENENVTACVVVWVENSALNRTTIKLHKAVRVGGKDVNRLLVCREHEPLSDLKV